MSTYLLVILVIIFTGGISLMIYAIAYENGRRVALHEVNVEAGKQAKLHYLTQPKQIITMEPKHTLNGNRPVEDYV